MVVNGYIPKNNETRIVKRFALFPITIYDNHCDPWLERRYYERRWFETVYIEQTYESHIGCWNNSRFVSKERYIQYRTEDRC